MSFYITVFHIKLPTLIRFYNSNSKGGRKAIFGIFNKLFFIYYFRFT